MLLFYRVKRTKLLTSEKAMENEEKQLVNTGNKNKDEVFLK